MFSGNAHISCSCLISLRDVQTAKGFRRSKEEQKLFGNRDLYQGFPAKLYLFGIEVMGQLLFNVIMPLHAEFILSLYNRLILMAAAPICIPSVSGFLK